MCKFMLKKIPIKFYSLLTLDPASPSIIPGGTDKVFNLYSSDESDHDDDDDQPTPKAITPPRPTQQARVCWI